MRWVPVLSIAAVLVACASSKPGPATPVATGGDAGLDEDTGDDAGVVTTEDDAGAEPTAEEETTGPCPKNMVLVEAGDLRFCIDVFEGSLVESDGAGAEKPYPHWLPVDGHNVRAVSVPGVFPQGYISELQADDACVASGKRLCNVVEWKTACMGPQKTVFPYGGDRQTGTCHDTGKSAVGAVFGMQALAPVAAAPPPARKGTPAKPAPGKPAKGQKPSVATKGRPATPPTKGRAASTTQTRATKLPPGVKVPPKTAPKKVAPARASTRPASVAPSVWAQLNDPRLGQVDGALSKTGSHAQCTNEYGAVDMVGNLHEWVKTDANLPHGTFAGGYYLDTSINGDGCNYRTTAHAHDYHDYSTGFRCCADVR